MNFTLPDGKLVHLIGDPHLGKKFEHGVPMQKRGLRERKQFQQFRDELETEADIIVMVGDLFDHPYVGYAVVDETAAAIRSAAERHEDRIFIFIAGNHDLPKDTTKVGAFHDLVDRLSGRYENVHIVRRPTVISNIALMPWEWDRRADEQLQEIEHEEAHAVIGHWDLATFEGKNDHLAPVGSIHRAFGEVPIWSGHYHVPGPYTVAGCVVECTGSMQPYSHGEDPSGAIYITLPLSEALSRPSGDFKDKCVRVILAPGESLPELDAMAVTPLRVATAKQATEVTQSLDDWDWTKMLRARIKKLDPEVQTFVKERLSNA